MNVRVALGVMVVASACGGDDAISLVDGIFTDAEWEKVQTHSPLPAPPPDPTNAYADDPAAATLGQMLFFEASSSGPLEIGDDGTNGALGAVGETGKVSCASCHDPQGMFSDTRSQPGTVALGAGYGIRNAMSLVNAAYHTPFQHWDGRFDTGFGPALGPGEAPKSTNGSRLAIAHMLWTKYRAEYDAVFDPDLPAALDPTAPDAARFPPTGKPKPNAMAPDGAWEGMTDADRMIVNRIFVNWGKSIAAYIRLLRSTNAPFDRYVAGSYDAISVSAKRGLGVFIGKAACSACHEGPAFTDNKFHNTGIAQTGERVPEMDQGRFGSITPLLAHGFNSAGPFSDDVNTGRLDGLTPDEPMRGAFLTPILRNNLATGPFMHAGQLATIEDVIELYDRGGDETGFSGVKDELMVPLDLTDAEKTDLIEFLKTLDGEPISTSLLEDTSKP